MAALISVPLQSNWNFGAGFHHDKTINFIPEDNFLKSLNNRTGALMPAKSSQIYPTPAGDTPNLRPDY